MNEQGTCSKQVGRSKICIIGGTVESLRATQCQPPINQCGNKLEMKDTDE